MRQIALALLVAALACGGDSPTGTETNEGPQWVQFQRDMIGVTWNGRALPVVVGDALCGGNEVDLLLELTTATFEDRLPADQPDTARFFFQELWTCGGVTGIAWQGTRSEPYLATRDSLFFPALNLWVGRGPRLLWTQALDDSTGVIEYR